MKRLEAEFVMANWEQASGADQLECGRLALPWLRTWLERLEHDMPALADMCRLGTADVRAVDTGLIAAGVVEGIVHWRERCPALAPYWADLASRMTAVLDMYAALLPDVPMGA